MQFAKNTLSLAVLLSLSGAAAAAHLDHPAVGRAQALLQAHGAAVKSSGNDRFLARDVIIDANGSEHVRFQRSYAGLPVLGGDVVMHSRNGQFTGSSHTLRNSLRLDVRPALSGDDAIVRAGAAFGSDFSGVPESTLAVSALGKGAAQLVYQVHLHNDERDMTYLVDARSGDIVQSWSNLHSASASGTAKTLYSGNVTITTNSIASGYEMRDPTRSGGYTINAGLGATSGQIFKDSDNVWGNNSTSDLASAATDAQFGAALTWDYFKTAHGRNGIANNGRAAYSRVHYGRKYVNAYWSDNCFCMTYGDGDGVVYGPLVSLDVAGHEMTHGITSRTAGLIYSGESGGLNEATSDIFGAMVEFYANNAQDTPDYLIGERFYRANIPGSANQQALRFMFDPSKDGLSPNCYDPSIGDIDVHYSSGPANRFFYLLAEGSGSRTYSGVNHTVPTCNGSSITGVGRSKAGAIWYRALTVYMTSNSSYADARTATLNAASDLYGANSTERAAVATAWGAVSVN